MSKDRLESILKELDENKEVVKKEINYNSPTYRVLIGRKKNAEEKIKDLSDEYRLELRNMATFMVVTGSSLKKFISDSEDFGCFYVDASKFYEEISDTVPKQLYTNKSAHGSIVNLLNVELERKAHKIGIASCPMMLFGSNHRTTLNGKEDLLKFTQKIFNEHVGGEIVGLDAIDKVSKEALAEKFVAKTIPIVLFTENEDLALELSNQIKRMMKNVFLVGVGKCSESIKDNAAGTISPVNKKNIEKILTDIRKKI